MSDVTSFVTFDEDGNIVIDRDALEERLHEEDLEEALERDDVHMGNVKAMITSIEDAIEESDYTVEEIEDASDE